MEAFKPSFPKSYTFHYLVWGARDGTVVRALASHQCGTGSNPGVHTICGLSLLLILSFAPRGFSPGTPPVFPSPQKPTFLNSSSTRNQADEEPLWGCATSKSTIEISAVQLRFVTAIVMKSPFLFLNSSPSGMVFMPAQKLAGRVWT